MSAEEKGAPLKSRPLAEAVITFALNMPQRRRCCGGNHVERAGGCSAELISSAGCRDSSHQRNPPRQNAPKTICCLCAALDFPKACLSARPVPPVSCQTLEGKTNRKLEKKEINQTTSCPHSNERNVLSSVTQTAAALGVCAMHCGPAWRAASAPGRNAIK